MACLCAPTTHQGSFRCRLHRTQTAAQLHPHRHHHHHQPKEAFASRYVETSDPACRLRARDCAAAPAEMHRPRCSSRLSSASPLALQSQSSPPRMATPTAASSSSAVTLASSPSPHHCPRPPSPKGAGSPTSTEPSTTSPSGSSRSHDRRSAALSLESGLSSAGCAAATAIMRQHLQKKLHTPTRSVMRSSAALKIGRSRLSRMSCAEDSPLLKCTPAAEMPSSVVNSSSCIYDESQVKQLVSLDAMQVNLKMHGSKAKIKQSESSCKLLGFNTRHHIVSTVY